MAPRIGVGPCPREPTSLKQGPWAVVQVTVSTDHGSLTLVVRVKTHTQKMTVAAMQIADKNSSLHVQTKAQSAIDAVGAI
jgi:hypothetical protein